MVNCAARATNFPALMQSLTQTAEGTVINDVRFAPMYMQNRGGYNNLQKRYRKVSGSSS